MRYPSFASLALVLTCPLAHAAPKTTTRDVKICVRIDEKSWTDDGAPRTLARSSDAKGTRSAPPLDAATTAATSAGTEAPATSGAPPTAPGEPAPDGAGEPSGEPAPEAPALATPEKAPPLPSATALAGAPTDELDAAFLAVDPDTYLKRLVEYHVTHEPGFESVEQDCTQTLTVELYAVQSGWTAFARYSGNGREEKVDVVRLDELGIFAERVTTALLRDKTISETLTRTTVLRADSEMHVRQIKTRTHFLLSMGSTARVGLLPTAPNETDPAEDRLRLETPLTFAIGARNKFRAWALDATARLNVGLAERASYLQAGGGHVDYSVGLGLGLGFLSYTDPDAVNTLYYGGGGSFDLSRYQILPEWEEGYGERGTPDGLWGGGLNVDAVIGYEFMRTSTLHFFVQGLLSIPAYVFESESDLGRVHSYIPSASAQVGLLF